MRVMQTDHFTAIAADAVGATYRFLMPMRVLIENGIATGNVLIDPVHDAPPSGSTIVVAARCPRAREIAAAAKRNGQRVVIDFDEFPVASHQRLERLIIDADAVTVASPALAHALKETKRVPEILPTTIDPRDWTAKPKRAARARLRAGWYGGQQTIAVVAQLCENVTRSLIDEVDFLFFERLPNALSDLSPRIECATAVPLSLFAGQFAALDLDIVLVPRGDGHSAERSGHLPLLMAGILSYPVIASDIAPHTALPVTRVANRPDAWTAALRDRMNDMDALHGEGEVLRLAVERSFLAGTWSRRYLQAWTGRRDPDGLS